MDKRLKCKSCNHKNPRRNIGNKISYISCSSIFVNISPRTLETKEETSKQNYIKIKSFYTAEKMISTMKRDLTV